MSTPRDAGSSESRTPKRSRSASAGVATLAILMLVGAGTALVVLESCAHAPSGAPTPDGSSSPTTPPTTKTATPASGPTNNPPPPTLSTPGHVFQSG